MTGWIVFGVIVLLLTLLMLVRLGGEVTYGESGLRVRVRLGQIRITLIPRRKKPSRKSGNADSKKSPKKKKPPADTEQKPEEKGGSPVYLTDLISIAVDGVGQLLARLQIDRLELEYVIGGKTDPAGAAVRYGAVYAGGDAILPLLENTFYCIKKRELQAWIDFESDETLVWTRFSLSIRIGQMLAIFLKLGWAFLRAYTRKKREDKNNGTKESDQ